MRCSITHLGVPIGLVDLSPDGARAHGFVDVLPAYLAIQSAVQRATKALADVRDGTRETRTDRRANFREAAALTRALELRDQHGHLIEADYVMLDDHGGASPPELTVLGLHAMAG